MSITMAPKRTKPVNKRLKALRTKSGMSQTEFAKVYFATPLRTYQDWESGEDMPGPAAKLLRLYEQNGLDISR